MYCCVSNTAERVPPEPLLLPAWLQVVQHSRRALSEGGEGVVLQQVNLKVEVKPGQLEGTRYVFEG